MRAASAGRPPPGLPGLQPRWSRHVPATDADGVRRTWHVLDNLPDLDAATRRPVGTLLCVHGNPTWSYLWRDLLRQAGAGGSAPPWRVVAVDHLDMGFSERTGTTRPLARRVQDLTTLTDALHLTGPVVTVGHDWGGVISLGWALAHRDRLAGVVLTNTAVHQPAGLPAPTLLRIAGARGVLPAAAVRTSAFLRATLALARPRLPDDVRAGYLAPYADRSRRAAIGGFVADIPLDRRHRSHDTLAAVADGLVALDGVPALLLWGPRDPVFAERYLHDLMARLPHADVHRFEGAGHLLAEDVDVAGAVLTWLRARHVGTEPGPAPNGTGTGRAPSRTAPAPAPSGTAPNPGTTSAPDGAPSRPRRPMWGALAERAAATPAGPALVEVAPPGGHGPRTVTWRVLHARTLEIAAGLAARGVHPGRRVMLLVPPGPVLTAVLYACLRIGAVAVVADAGLGLRGLDRAVRAAAPGHLVGVPRALAAARALRWPGEVVGVNEVASLAAHGRSHPRLPNEPGPDDDAAILFTSGSTGPAKGVVYTHRRLEALRDTMAEGYRMGPQAALVAAFGPFTLLGPALGVAGVLPDMKITSPGTLSARALAAAARAAPAAPMVFASPAALRNVLRGAPDLADDDRAALSRVILVLSAGAPVPADLLLRLRDVLPNATPHTPYGMTEALAVTDVTLQQILAAGPGDGVCVGTPLPSVRLAVAPLDDLGRADGALTGAAGVTGEIAVQAAHVKDRYDRLWLTQQASGRDPGWHRTGDVGHLDEAGRLWVEGRLAHVLSTPAGPQTPVGPEQRIETVPGVSRAAVVGVGPAGNQQAVAVLETDPPCRRPRVAPLPLVDAVRAAARHPPGGAGGGCRHAAPAAVLVVPEVPTDIRHNSKIDRTRLAAWAERVLAGRAGLGGRLGRP